MATNDSVTVAVAAAKNTKKVTTAASTNATLVSGIPGQIVGGVLSNVAAYDVFVKLFDKATAPVPGTDAPVLTVKVPTGGAPVVLDGIGAGIQFSAGIGYSITKLIADSDTTNVAAGDVRGAILWK